MSTWRALTLDGLEFPAKRFAATGGSKMYSGFEGAFGDYGILDDLGLESEESKLITSLVSGSLTTFAVAGGLSYFVKDKTSKLYQYATPIGLAAGLGTAALLYKKQGRTAGIAAATTAALTGVALWFMPKIQARSMVVNGLGAYVASDPVPLLQGYEIEQGQPLLQGAPELLSEAPELLSEQPEVVSGWSPAFV